MPSAITALEYFGALPDVAIDDHSRIAFSQILPNQKAPSAAAFLQAAVDYYARLGIAISRVLTDNDPCYRSGHFRQLCQQLGIRQRFTRPYTPRTNGKAERFIQTALREWAYSCSYDKLSGPRSQAATLAPSVQLASPAC